ncbi:MAG: hypothetical protein JWQ01_585 [Massilia sp.]|jgi:hypothetical protein|nr:hypothetical protein [Massilia sp.]
MNTQQEREDGTELMSRWFFGEIAFVLLPLAIIVAVRSFLGLKLADMFTLPEWSFAAIVLLAVGLNKVMALKTKLRKDASNKVFHGSRVVVMLLIIAAVTLAFSVSKQQGLKVDNIILSATQVVLVVIASAFLYAAIAHEIRHESEVRELPATLTSNRMAALIRCDVKDVEEKLRGIEWALARVDSRAYFTSSSSPKYSEISTTLEDISISCNRILRHAEKIDRVVTKATAPKGIGNVSDIAEAK